MRRDGAPGSRPAAPCRRFVIQPSGDARSLDRMRTRHLSRARLGGPKSFAYPTSVPSTTWDYAPISPFSGTAENRRRFRFIHPARSSVTSRTFLPLGCHETFRRPSADTSGATSCGAVHRDTTRSRPEDGCSWRDRSKCGVHAHRGSSATASTVAKLGRTNLRSRSNVGAEPAEPATQRTPRGPDARFVLRQT